MTMKRLTVLPEDEDLRLDRALERLLPDMGLRGRRRLCELGLALVNGRPAPASRKMKAGDNVEVPDPSSTASMKEKNDAPRGLFPDDAPRLVARFPHLAALYKPAAMHTETLAGKPGVSLQALLPSLLGADARLLNRLDFPTSALTAAAKDEEGERLYKDAQDNGRTEKRYLALLEGELSHETVATQKLILKNRTRVLVELADHPDARRHTRVLPLAVLDAAELIRKLKLRERGWTGLPPDVVTLAGCSILKGARHQIRAHCSALGYPLLGDRRYGARFTPGENDDEAFFLHHGRLTLPGLDAVATPVWLPLLEAGTANAAERWLKR